LSRNGLDAIKDKIGATMDTQRIYFDSLFTQNFKALPMDFENSCWVGSPYRLLYKLLNNNKSGLASLTRSRWAI